MQSVIEFNHTTAQMKILKLYYSRLHNVFNIMRIRIVLETVSDVLIAYIVGKSLLEVYVIGIS